MEQKKAFAILLLENTIKSDKYANKFKPLTDTKLREAFEVLQIEHFHLNKMRHNFVISSEYFTWTPKKSKIPKGHFITKITGVDKRVFYFDPNGCIGAINGGIASGSFEDRLRDGGKGDGRKYEKIS